MQSSDIGMLMLIVIAVLGSLISFLDHRSLFRSGTRKSPSKEKAIRTNTNQK